MGPLALLLALAALAAVAIPGTGKLVALGLAIFATAAGLQAFRRTGGRPTARLLGAGGAAVAIAALVVAGAKVALTLIAVEHIAGLAP